MAASEDSVYTDPNFAVITSFFEQFGEACGVPNLSIHDLQHMLEDTRCVHPTLVDMHVKLLRKSQRRNVIVEKWEKSVVKFCHTYSKVDAWEIERFGYKKAKLSVKIQLLKQLLESQFDGNTKFKAEVNKLTAKQLRIAPIGRDSLGQMYWFQLDKELNLRLYREDQDEETWELIAKERAELADLIEHLEIISNFGIKKEDSTTPSDTGESKDSELFAGKQSVKLDDGCIPHQIKNELLDNKDVAVKSETSAKDIKILKADESSIKVEENVGCDTNMKDKDSELCASPEKVQSSPPLEPEKNSSVEVQIKEEPMSDEESGQPVPPLEDTKLSPSSLCPLKPHADCDKPSISSEVEQTLPDLTVTNPEMGIQSERHDVSGTIRQSVIRLAEKLNDKGDLSSSCCNDKGGQDLIQTESDVATGALVETPIFLDKKTREDTRKICRESNGGSRSKLSILPQSLAVEVISKSHDVEPKGKFKTEMVMPLKKREIPKNLDTSKTAVENSPSSTLMGEGVAKTAMFLAGNEESQDLKQKSCQETPTSLNTSSSEVQDELPNSVAFKAIISEETLPNQSMSGDQASGNEIISSREDSIVKSVHSFKARTILQTESTATEDELVPEKTVDFDDTGQLESCEPLNLSSCGSLSSKVKSPLPVVKNFLGCGKVSSDVHRNAYADNLVEGSFKKGTELQTSSVDSCHDGESGAKLNSVSNVEEHAIKPIDRESCKSIPSVFQKARGRNIKKDDHKLLQVDCSLKEECMKKTLSPCSKEETASSRSGKGALKCISSKPSDCTLSAFDFDSEVTSCQNIIKDTSSLNRENIVRKEESEVSLIVQKSDVVSNIDKSAFEITGETTAAIPPLFGDQVVKSSTSELSLDSENASSLSVDQVCMEKPIVKKYVLPAINLVTVERQETGASVSVNKKETLREPRIASNNSRRSSSEKELDTPVRLERVAFFNDSSVGSHKKGKDDTISGGRSLGSIDAIAANLKKKLAESQKNEIATNLKMKESIALKIDAKERRASDQENNSVSGKKETDDKVAVVPSVMDIVDESIRDTVDHHDVRSKSACESEDIIANDKMVNSCTENEKPKEHVELHETRQMSTLGSEEARQPGLQSSSLNESNQIEVSLPHSVGGGDMLLQSCAEAETLEPKQNSLDMLHPNCNVAEISVDASESQNIAHTVEDAALCRLTESTVATEHEGVDKKTEESCCPEDLQGKDDDDEPKKKTVLRKTGLVSGGPRKRGRGRGNFRGEREVKSHVAVVESLSQVPETPALPAQPNDEEAKVVDDEAPAAEVVGEQESTSKPVRPRGRPKRGTGCVRVEFESEVSPPLKRSRRLQEQREKVEVELRVVEEERQRLALMKQQHREAQRKKRQELKQAAGAKQNGEVKRKRGRPRKKPILEAEVQKKSLQIKKKKERMRRKQKKKLVPKIPVPRKKKGKGPNPWDVSSESSSPSEFEEEEEHEEIEEEEITFNEKSDHEFSPESEDEIDSSAAEIKRARTVKKAKSDGEESSEDEQDDDKPCSRCGKYDHPEWILLCDRCDNGYHTSCLRPPLMIIPDGEWFCPPCEHKMLVDKLREQMVNLDQLLKKKERDEMRKKRLAYVGISLDNVLKPERKDSVDEVEDEEEGDDDEEEDIIYNNRTRRVRKEVSYKFKEFDELINSAIQDDLLIERGAALSGWSQRLNEQWDNIQQQLGFRFGEDGVLEKVPPGVGKGKDMATITKAEEELKEKELIENKEKINDNKDDAYNEECCANKDDCEDENVAVVPHHRKRKHRRLNDLDSPSDEDDDSDEDFKETSPESEASEGSNELVEESDESWHRSRSGSSTYKSRHGKHGKRKKHDDYYDDDFIVGDSEESEDDRRVGRRAASRRVNYKEVSESGEDDDWSGKSKVAKGLFKGSRQRFSSEEDSEESDWRSSKSRGLFKGQRRKLKKTRRLVSDDDDEEEEDEEDDDDDDDDHHHRPQRCTRGKKVNFKDLVGSEESDDGQFKKKKHSRIISRSSDDSDDDFKVGDGSNSDKKEVETKKLDDEKSKESSSDEDEEEGEEDDDEEDEDDEDESEIDEAADTESLTDTTVKKIKEKSTSKADAKSEKGYSTEEKVTPADDSAAKTATTEELMSNEIICKNQSSVIKSTESTKKVVTVVGPEVGQGSEAIQRSASVHSLEPLNSSSGSVSHTDENRKSKLSNLLTAPRLSDISCHPSPLKPAAMEQFVARSSPSRLVLLDSASGSSYPSPQTKLTPLEPSYSPATVSSSPGAMPSYHPTDDYSPYAGQYLPASYSHSVSQYSPSAGVYQSAGSPPPSGAPAYPMYHHQHSPPSYSYVSQNYGDQGQYQTQAGPLHYAPYSSYGSPQNSGEQQSNGNLSINNIIQRRVEGASEEDEFSGVNDLVSYITGSNSTQL